MRWILVVALFGCASDRLAVKRAQLGTPAARQVGSFHTDYHRELTPPNVDEAALDDEATLVDDRCVDLTIRDVQDVGIVLYEPVFIVDGVRVEPSIENEKASSLILPAGAKVESGADCDQRIGMDVAAFCVVIRTARLCAPSAGNAIELKLVHPTLVNRSKVSTRVTRFWLTFAWAIR